MKTRSWLWMVLMAVGVGARAATVSVTWDAVTTNADGSPIADLSGYRLFYANHSLLGLTTGQATTDGTVTKKTIPSSTVGDTLTLLDGASYYFRVTAFDQSGNQSDFNVDNANLDVEISTISRVLRRLRALRH